MKYTKTITVNRRKSAALYLFIIISEKVRWDFITKPTVPKVIFIFDDKVLLLCKSKVFQPGNYFVRECSW